MRSSFITTSGSKGFFVLLIVEKRTTYLLENKSESNGRKKTIVQQTDEKTGALHSDNHLGLVSKAAQKNVDVKLA